MMLTLSLSKVILSEQTNGVVLGYEGSYTTLRELKKFLEVLVVGKFLGFIYLVVPPFILYLSQFPLGFALQVFEAVFL